MFDKQKRKNDQTVVPPGGGTVEDNGHPDQSIWGESSLHQTRGAPGRPRARRSRRAAGAGDPVDAGRVDPAVARGRVRRAGAAPAAVPAADPGGGAGAGGGAEGGEPGPHRGGGGG